jgi:hypothetical protein
VYFYRSRFEDVDLPTVAFDAVFSATQLEKWFTAFISDAGGRDRYTSFATLATATTSTARELTDST